MPPIIYDFKPLQEAARLLEGADVHQPMTVKTATIALDVTAEAGVPAYLDDAYGGNFMYGDGSGPSAPDDPYFVPEFDGA